MNTVKFAAVRRAVKYHVGLGAGLLLLANTVIAATLPESELTSLTAVSIGMQQRDNPQRQAEQEQHALAQLRQVLQVDANKDQASALAADVALAEGALTESTMTDTTLAEAPAATSAALPAPTPAKSLKLMAAPPMTREQVQAEHLNNLPRSSATPQDLSQAAVYHSFFIDSARSRLFEDADRDGFYRTFSVTFDVDVSGTYLNERAEVFAELYLSRDGGPWVRYYTTEVFSIYGSASQDEYEVLTTLYNGYATDHYDVLIDVYEVGYSEVVATISADDVNSLYALPLESRDRDQQSDVIIVEGGAVSGLALLWLGLYAFVRRRGYLA